MGKLRDPRSSWSVPWVLLEAMLLAGGLVILNVLVAFAQETAFLDAAVSGDWRTAANAVGAPDNSCAASQETQDGDSVHIWRWNSGTFNIPAGSTISGLEVGLDYAASGGDVRIELSPDAISWGTPDEFQGNNAQDCQDGGLITRGSPSDLWGGSWTASNINDDVYIRITAMADTGDVVRVDAVDLAIYGTTPTAVSIVSFQAEPVVSSEGGRMGAGVWMLAVLFALILGAATFHRH